MILLIDGLQNSGKTTLAQHSVVPYKRFNFDFYLNSFGLNDSEINGFQLGKDLGIAFALENELNDYILDRGPIATAYYSLKYKRWHDIKKVDQFFSCFKSYKNFAYVIIRKINGNLSQRKKNDGFDELNDDVDPSAKELFEQVIKSAKKNGLIIYEFDNDFSKGIEENQVRFDDFIKRILYCEYY